MTSEILPATSILQREGRRRRLAVLLLVSPLLIVAILTLDARLRRARSARTDEALNTLAMRLASPDLALSGGARWLRSLSLEEPTAALQDGPGFPDPDPAGAALAPPIDVWEAMNERTRATRASSAIQAGEGPLRDFVVHKGPP